VVSPDLGYAKSAAAFARRLSLPVAAGAKERISDTEVRIITAIIGDVAGRDVIVLDHEIARGTTVFELLDRLHEEGARSAAVACTHGLFVDNARRTSMPTGGRPGARISLMCQELRQPSPLGSAYP